MITREKIDKLNEDEKTELILQLVGTHSTVIEAIHAYKKQIVGMVKYMQEKDLITESSMSDKDDKAWDRGKFIMDNLDKYIDKLHILEQKLLPLTAITEKPKKTVRTNAITEFLDEQAKQIRD